LFVFDVSIIALLGWCVLLCFLTAKTLGCRMTPGHLVGQSGGFFAAIAIAAYSPALAVVFLSIQALLFYANIQHIRFFGNSLHASEIRHFWEERSQASEYSAIIADSFLTLGRRSDLFLAFAFAGTCAALLLQPPQTALLPCAVATVAALGICYLFYRSGLSALGPLLNLLFEVAHPVSDELPHFDRARLPVSEQNVADKWFGTFRGKNVILLQLESFQQFIVGHRIHGVEITPFLNQLARSGISFSNIHSQYGMGHTADVELAVLQSLYPQRDEVANYRHFNKRFRGLPRILKDEGYTTAAFHGFSGDGYNRRTMFRAFGFDSYFAREDLVSTDVIGFGMSDISFFKQITRKLAAMAKPFFGFAITLTSHYPYELPEVEKRLDLSGLSDGLSDYLHCLHYADRALGVFWKELEHEGLLENTVIALYGDHEGVIHRDITELAEHLGMEPDDDVLAFTGARLAKVPFVVWSADWQPPYPYAAERNGSALDISPTVLHLLGLPPIPYGFGHELFTAHPNRTIPLAVHPPGSYVGEREILLVTDTRHNILFDLAGNSVIRTTPNAKARREYAETQLSIARHALHCDALLPGDEQAARAIGFAPHVEKFLTQSQSESGALLIPFALQIEKNHIHALHSKRTVQIFLRSISQALSVQIGFWHYFDVRKNKAPVYFASSDYLHYFREAGYETQVVSGTRIDQYFDSLPDHSLIMIAAQDEASAQFFQALVIEMRHFGFSRLDKSAYRHSYLNLVYKNRGYTSLFEQCGPSPLRCQLDAGSVVKGFVIPVSIDMRSVGAMAGASAAHIEIDGIDSSASQRGLNMVAINMDTGAVLSSMRIDSCQTIFADDSIYLAKPR
jgi:hypothetical protein